MSSPILLRIWRSSQRKWIGTMRIISDLLQIMSVDVLNSVPGASMEELLKIVKHNVDTFVGDAPQFDDLTMLTINYK